MNGPGSAVTERVLHVEPRTFVPEEGGFGFKLLVQTQCPEVVYVELHGGRGKARVSELLPGNAAFARQFRMRFFKKGGIAPVPDDPKRSHFAEAGPPV